MNAQEMIERSEGSEPAPRAKVDARLWFWAGLVLVFALSGWLTIQLWRGGPTAQAWGGWNWPIRGRPVAGFGLLGACFFAFPYFIRAAVSVAEPRQMWRVLLGLVVLGFCFH